MSRANDRHHPEYMYGVEVVQSGMKVIERKNSPNQWPRQYRCGADMAEGGTATRTIVKRHCGSLLEVDAIDIVLPGQRDGNQGWFRCPVCRELTYLSPEDTARAAHWKTQQRTEGER